MWGRGCGGGWWRVSDIAERPGCLVQRWMIAEEPDDLKILGEDGNQHAIGLESCIGRRLAIRKTPF